MFSEQSRVEIGLSVRSVKSKSHFTLTKYRLDKSIIVNECYEYLKFTFI